jgi:phage-related protein
MIDIEGGSVVIDSETMECFDSAGRLANDRVSMDEFPRLLPGDNPVTWSGNVTSVLIDGRWRNL